MSKMKRVLKLTTGELVIGESYPNGDDVVVEFPYSIYETFDETTGQQKVALMPYEFPYLMTEMTSVNLRAFDIMWSKKLEDFPVIESQYLQATTGIDTSSEQIIL